MTKAVSVSGIGYIVKYGGGQATWTTTIPSDGSVVEGALFELTFRVSEVSNSTCNLLEGVFVELSANSSYEFTSQLFFDDALSDQVFAVEPYASKGERSIRNADDGIFKQGGSQLLLEVSQGVSGYAATLEIGLQLA